MKFVNMHTDLVWFPAIGAHVITSPSNQEFHGRLSIMIVTMRYNFALLNNPYWVDVIGVKYKRTEISNVRSDLLSANQIFNDEYRMFTSDKVIRSGATCYHVKLGV